MIGRSAGYTVERPVTESITALLAIAEGGDRAAADAVFAALYDELHRMARRELARRGGGMTLSATELLHDAYVNISQREGIKVIVMTTVAGMHGGSASNRALRPDSQGVARRLRQQP